MALAIRLRPDWPSGERRPGHRACGCHSWHRCGRTPDTGTAAGTAAGVVVRGPPRTKSERQLGCCCLKDALQHQALAKLGKRKASRTAAPAAPAPARYVFLDIDGVLAPFGGRDPPPRPAHEDCAEFFAPFDPACLGRLAAVVERSGAEIVLSSSWRASPGAVDAIRERFRAFGPPLAAQRLEETTDVKRHELRQWEIHRYLERRRLLGAAWVALDDEDLVDGAENRARRDVFVDRAVLVRSDVGLADDDVRRALEILGVGGAPD